MEQAEVKEQKEQFPQEKQTLKSRWKNTRLTGTITGQILVVTAGLITGTVLLCWILNSTLLEGYYTREKQASMQNGYRQIAAAAVDGTLYKDDFDIEFDKICNNGNVTIIVIGADGTMERSSSNDFSAMREQFMEAIFGTRQETVEVIENTPDYVFQRQIDTRLNSEYLVLWGTLEDGNLLMMRTPVESIKESVHISNKFLAIVGIFSVIIAGVIGIFTSRKIADPVLELTEISKRMSELDFNIKYTGHSNNEIDSLGEHINRLSQTLEKTISELKSANNELQIDIEKKTEIDEMRKEFLSNVSHELKTPLALIQGYAEGLQMCINEDAESRDFYCEVIMDETQKMNRMVKKLLTLNQLEFGNDKITMERFDLTELITGVVNASSILLRQKEISLTFEHNGPMYVWADEFKVEEVMTNYLSNAINHVDFERHIDIRYTVHETYVRISVFNTGKPIPEEDIDNIWIKFYKVDKARTREYGGNGIGLSIVKAIMDSFHKECGVINHENGVEFWLELDITAHSKL